MEVTVFVSYSHKDSEYLGDEELLAFLRGLEKEGVRFWWDEALVAGDDFDNEIKAQIENSQVAVVLVSQWFLDSDYCTKVEVEEFLRHASEKGLVIFPIILSPCEWQRHEWLKSRHFLPRGGETVEFGGLLGTAPIMAVNKFSSDAFIRRGGRIPAPIHSLRN